ncbi:hypothetical protein POM88_051615 [Heracleum sosnowskyi]|uniref:Uncharacterized protein n=1 Tax=Heracleum sosnowskyi TaxID=360622 RepID=A0AAD8H0T5_9APIA|nr:hypothetical protein POM88_051615 [Heracleum sosnowskyi]
MITGMKMRPDENLKLHHSILYGKTIKVHVLKRNIGLFSGFVWDVNEEDLSMKLLEFLESPHVTTEILLADIEKAKKLKRKAKSSKSPRSGRKAVKTASKITKDIVSADSSYFLVPYEILCFKNYLETGDTHL